MKTVGLIIEKDSLLNEIPEAKLTENHTQDEPKKPANKPSKAKKPPKENKPPKIAAEETSAPEEEKETENGTD